MWSPSPELLSFPRRKAWYCCEPQCQFNAIENGKWPKIRSRLLPEQFLFHGHPDPNYRVPHMTHYDELVVDRSEHRVRKAIAVVSNCGNGPFSTHKDIQYRNGLITDPRVDLYGRRSWQQYRAYWYSWPRPPLNYRGEIPGDWPGGTKRQLMSQYKVCVCLENMNEPGYFTEKFVEAVRAGCIPVYKASADVRDTFLKGAVWFDPSDTKCLGRNAIGAALDASWHDIVDVDAQWLQKNDCRNASTSERRTSSIASFKHQVCSDRQNGDELKTTSPLSVITGPWQPQREQTGRISCRDRM